ncbi:MAG: hypothetical protein JWM97_949 [Phycisphaerales bacterium]|nr:hypothetical protein [Phycisphaerales bacterium]MDB5303400.1 hypothetical protein [Phycisphaerales bacterium]
MSQIDYLNTRHLALGSSAEARLSPRVRAVLLLLAIVAGIGCRVAQYAANRSYWQDEASLVLNIRNHTAGELMGRLDYEQAAPPMFLLAERGIFKLFGGTELALRSLPVACGIASVLLFALLARRVAGSPWDIVAVFCFALSDNLIRHTVEVKQYGTDAFTAVLLLLLGVGARPNLSAARRLAWVSGVATVAVWFSYPAVLVFAAISLSLLPAVVGRSLRGGGIYLLCNLPVGASFLKVLMASVKAQRDAYLVSYWNDAFVDFHHPLSIPRWFLHQTHSLANYAAPAAGPVVLVAMVVGIIWLVRAGKEQMPGIVAGPIGMAILAAAAHRYPFDGARLSTFLAAPVLLLATIGLRCAFEGLAKYIGPWGWVPTGYMLAIAAYWSGLHLLVPRNRGHLRPVAAYLREHIRADDGIYAFEQREFACYWPAGDARVRGDMDAADRIPWKRYWIIWSFPHDKRLHRLDPLLAWSKQFAVEKDRFQCVGGLAVLFEKNGQEVPAGLGQPPEVGVDHNVPGGGQRKERGE